jgi:tetratricopeptide (TPR) repeat protein
MIRKITMVMATGKMTVDRFEKEFKDSFGVFCDVLSKGSLAPNDVTLASLRPDDFKGTKKGKFDVRGNMLAKNVKKNFKDNFGLDLELYQASVADDSDTLASLRKKGEEDKGKGSGFKVSGRLTVGRFKSLFEDAYGSQVDILDSNEVAKDNKRLNDLRVEGFSGTKRGDIKIRGNMIVENVRKVFLSLFGINIQLYKLESADESTTLSSLKDTQSDSDFSKMLDDMTQKVIDGELSLEESFFDFCGDDEDEEISDDEDEELTGFYDYYNKAATLVDDGNIVEGRDFYIKAFEIGDFCEVLSVLGRICDEKKVNDKALGKKMAAELLEKAEDSSDIISLAGFIADDECVGDTPWASELYKNVLGQTEDSEVLLEVANAISFFLPGSQEWAKETYQRAIDAAENSWMMRGIALGIGLRDGGLKDREWAKEVFQKALDKAESAEDVSLVASNIGSDNYLGDKEWAVSIFKSALELANDSNEFADIGFRIANSLGDENWARKIFVLALNKANQYKHLLTLGDFVCDEDVLNDKKWALEIYQKAEKFCKGDSDLIREVHERIEELEEDEDDD